MKIFIFLPEDTSILLLHIAFISDFLFWKCFTHKPKEEIRVNENIYGWIEIVGILWIWKNKLYFLDLRINDSILFKLFSKKQDNLKIP